VQRRAGGGGQLPGGVLAALDKDPGAAAVSGGA